MARHIRERLQALPRQKSPASPGGAFCCLEYLAVERTSNGLHAVSRRVRKDRINHLCSSGRRQFERHQNLDHLVSVARFCSFIETEIHPRQYKPFIDRHSYVFRHLHPSLAVGRRLRRVGSMDDTEMSSNARRPRRHQRCRRLGCKSTIPPPIQIRRHTRRTGCSSAIWAARHRPTPACSSRAAAQPSHKEWRKAERLSGSMPE
jgi:hypothetical protein